MSDRPDWPTPTPVTPRASESRPGAGGGGAANEMDELLGRYAALTAVAPRPDWVRQLHLRIIGEPSLTPSRRFLLALGALAPRDAAAAFGQSVGAALGRGRFPAVARAQAMALVLLVVLSAGVIGAGGAVVLDAVVRRPDGSNHTPPVVAASPTPTIRPTPRTQPPTPGIHDATPVTPAHLAAPSSAEPDVPVSAPSGPPINGPSPSASAPDAGGPPGADRTPRPHPTPKADRTPRPHPTPKADRTPRPRRTPGP